MLILRCEHLWELPSLLTGARLSGSCLSCLSREATVRLSGGCLSCEAPEGTTTVAVASSPALESAPAVTTSDLSLQGPGCSRGRATDLHSSGSLGGRSVLAVLCPPSLFLPQGERPILEWVPGALGSQACAAGIGLPAMQPLLCGASAQAATQAGPRSSQCCPAAL